tara:strand:+ start:1154 stop:1645 length:492 start_codon:yes stop_codon:yes gene_type:complete
MHILIRNKLLNCGNYKVKCAVGKRGIKIKKKEGDLITPKGLFKIKRVLYRKDRIGRLNTKLKKTPIKKNMGWCDDPSSKFYNKLINFPFKFNAEKLFKRENIYDIILVLDFNMNPIRKNKGSAIFIHIAKKKFTPTKGCVAISKNVLKKILSKINKDCKVRIT